MRKLLLRHGWAGVAVLLLALIGCKCSHCGSNSNPPPTPGGNGVVTTPKTTPGTATTPAVTTTAGVAGTPSGAPVVPAVNTRYDDGLGGPR
jgi:hypothetical protein